MAPTWLILAPRCLQMEPQTRPNSHLGPSWRQRGRPGPPNQPWRSKFKGFSFISKSILHQMFNTNFIPFSVIHRQFQHIEFVFQFSISTYTYTLTHRHRHGHRHRYTHTHIFNRFFSFNFLPRVMARWRLCARSALDIRRPLPKAGAMAC